LTPHLKPANVKDILVRFGVLPIEVMEGLELCNISTLTEGAFMLFFVPPTLWEKDPVCALDMLGSFRRAVLQASVRPSSGPATYSEGFVLKSALPEDTLMESDEEFTPQDEVSTFDETQAPAFDAGSDDDTDIPEELEALTSPRVLPPLETPEEEFMLATHPSPPTPQSTHGKRRVDDTILDSVHRIRKASSPQRRRQPTSVPAA